MAIDRVLFSDTCLKTFELNGFSDYCNDEIISKLYELTVRMLEVNENMNLTAIKDIDGIVLKHYADSMAVSKHIPNNSKIIDIGTGAGFPSLVLSIIRPDLTVTALDSTAKRIAYINETASQLGLDNITAVTARAEELAHNGGYREQFDVACARAVARLNVLAELCLPFSKPGGSFIAMKANFEDELSEAESGIKKLGGKVKCKDAFSLNSPTSSDDNPRCIICIDKVSNTPDSYPRIFSQIKKKPL